MIREPKVFSQEAYEQYPHHLENMDISWILETKDRVSCKVSFFNSCGFFKKILLSLIHGRNFRPTENEKRLYYFYKKQDAISESDVKQGDSE